MLFVVAPSHSTESVEVYILQEDRGASTNDCYNRAYSRAAQPETPTNLDRQYNRSMTVGTTPVDHKRGAPSDLPSVHHKSLAYR